MRLNTVGKCKAVPSIFAVSSRFRLSKVLSSQCSVNGFYTATKFEERETTFLFEAKDIMATSKQFNVRD